MVESQNTGGVELGSTEYCFVGEFAADGLGKARTARKASCSTEALSSIIIGTAFVAVGHHKTMGITFGTYKNTAFAQITTATGSIQRQAAA